MQQETDHVEGGWLGQPVIDENSHPIGKVIDIVYDDDAAAKPDWAVVGVGPLRKGHYMPLTSAYRTSDGRLVVPYDQRSVKSAPKAAKNQVMTREDRAEARRHYNVDA
jgi:hypothetical protein